jgi:DNA-binding NtrC family response regulator
MKLGAYEYITKPVQRDQILSIVGRIAEERHGTGTSRAATVTGPRKELQKFIGRSPKILSLLELVEKVAQVDVPVLIAGESGTGKELVARRIHQSSSRRDKPFVAINCGALPENLQESELFGYRRGAFTGATDDRKGLLEEADLGTVLLDEIAEMSPQTQVKLLRALQDGEVRPLGGNEVSYLKCRVIASSNKDLTTLVTSNEFRKDLLFRLNVIQIEIPPLRERVDDIPLLVDHFVGVFNRVFGKSITGVTPEALRYLERRNWVGNVRELRNCIERAVLLCTASFIDVGDLTQVSRQSGPEGPQQLLKEQEKNLILETLKKTRWNQKRAAAELGIGETTLWRKIKKFDLRMEDT